MNNLNSHLNREKMQIMSNEKTFIIKKNKIKRINESAFKSSITSPNTSTHFSSPKNSRKQSTENTNINNNKTNSALKI